MAELDLSDLAKIDEREKVVLLAAAAQLQLGKHEIARCYIDASLEWECSQQVIAKILIAGLHNTLGRIAALTEKDEKSKQHFKNAIETMIGDMQIETAGHTRVLREMANMSLIPQANEILDSFTKEEYMVTQESIDSLRQEIFFLKQELCSRNIYPIPSTNIDEKNNSEVVDSKRIVSLLEECITSDDILECSDRHLLGNEISRTDKFQLCVALSDYFREQQDKLTAQNFVVEAKCYLSSYKSEAARQYVILSKQLVKLNQQGMSLDYMLEHAFLAADLSSEEQKKLTSYYEHIRQPDRKKSEHGHDLLLNYLEKNLTFSINRDGMHKPVMVEIGTTRENVAGQGSTTKLAAFCAKSGIKFITVDMDTHNTRMAQYSLKKLSPDFEAISMKGEDYLSNYEGLIEYAFLDAYDFDHGNHSAIRQSRYVKFLGSRIDEQQCHKMHLDCAKALLDVLSPSGIICIDDTWQDDQNNWTAKGTLAVPFLLDHEFELIEARNRAVLLRRKPRVI